MKSAQQQDRDADREGCRRRRALDQTEGTSQARPPYRRHTARRSSRAILGRARRRGTARRLARMDSAAPKRVAREAEQSTPFRVLARAGYAARRPRAHPDRCHRPRRRVRRRRRDRPVGRADGDRTVPFGFVLLWSVAVTLWALAAWQLLEGILMRAASDDAPGSRRASGVGESARGVRRRSSSRSARSPRPSPSAPGSNTEEATEAASRELLPFPGGPVRARAGGPRHRHRRRRVHRDGGAAFVPQQDRHPRAPRPAVPSRRSGWSGSSRRGSRW